MDELDSTKYTPCCERCGWDGVGIAVQCQCACETCPTVVRETEFRLAQDMQVAAMRTAARKHPEFRFGI